LIVKVYKPKKPTRSSTVAEKLHDALSYLEMTLRYKKPQKLPNCHFTNVRMVFIDFQINFFLFSIYEETKKIQHHKETIKW